MALTTRLARRGREPSSPNSEPGSDRMPITQLETQIAPPTALTRLRRLFTSLNLDDSIVPGQPIRFTWTSIRVGAPLNLGRLSASIYLATATGDRLHGDPLYTAPAPADAPGDATLYTSPAYTFIPPMDQANDVYRIDDEQYLLLVLMGDGPNGDGDAQGPWGDLQPLIVRYESIDQTWWNFDGPAFFSAEWKRRYGVNGTFNNRSQFTDFASVNCTLVEVDADAGATRQYAPDQPAATVSRNSSAEITFSSADFAVNGQHWPWFIPGIWTVSGPGSRDFVYSIHADIIDAYNNAYPVPAVVPDLGHLEVAVAISAVKAAAAVTALAAMITAAACAVAALVAAATVVGLPAAAVLAAAAVTAYGIASAAGVTMGDPPFPDPRFGHVIELQDFRIPPALASSRELAAVGRVLKLGMAISMTAVNIDDTRSRILGAEVAQDSDAADRQWAHIGELVASMSADAQAIVAEVEAADAELATIRTQLDGGVAGTIDELLRDEARRAELSQVFTRVSAGKQAYPPVLEFLRQAKSRAMKDAVARTTVEPLAIALVRLAEEVTKAAFEPVESDPVV
jgi:hypothetical protein